MSNFCRMAESLDIFGCPKKFQKISYNVDVLYIILNHLTLRFAIYHLFGEMLEGNYYVQQCRNLPKFWGKKALTNEYAIKNLPKQIHLNEREMRKDGDQGESSKSQRTTRVSLPSAEASLPR